MESAAQGVQLVVVGRDKTLAEDTRTPEQFFSLGSHEKTLAWPSFYI